MSTVTTLDALTRAVSRVLQTIRPASGAVVVGRVGEVAAPAVPYILFSIESVTPQASPVVSYSDEDPPVTQTVTATAVPIVFLVEVIGGAAMGDAFRAALALRVSQRSFDLWAIAGLMDITAPTNLSALEVGTMRQRAQFRLALSAALDYSIGAETIEHLTIVANGETVTVSKGVNPHGC